MSYEQFRSEMTTKLLASYSIDVTQSILAAIDTVAANYDIVPKCTDLIVSTDYVPKIVEVYIAAKAVEGKAKTTLKQYNNNLRNFFVRTRLSIEKITANDIRVYLYVYQRERGVTNAALDNIRSNLCTFLEWCANEDYIPKNPAKKLQKIKYQKHKRPYMELLELEIMRSACKTLRERAIIDFLYSTGCRVSEACDMLLSDIDFDKRTVIVQHGKGDKQRLSYLNASSIVSLRAYINSRKDNDPHVFVRERSYLTGVWSIGSHAMENEIAKILNRTGITKHVTPHIFRHTMATTAIRSGMPVDQLQRLLGHANITTTMIYAESDDIDVQRSHAKYII